MKIKFTLLFGCVLSLVSIGFSIAQGTCPTLVEQALQAMGENCENVERNNACYGYNQVRAEFSEAVGEDFFAQPADTAALNIIESIQTAEMNSDLSLWGVAVLNLQANIPNSLPGQSVKFVLLGDVEVENAVEPDEGFEQSDGVSTTATSTANIRSGPGLSFNVIGGASAGTSLTVDGKSADGEWYRTTVGDRVGWIFGNLLDADAGLDALPVLDGTQRTTMQSFYLRTGFGSPACEEAPRDTLLIQGPEGIEVDFTVNGADIRLGSTIAVRILPPGDIIEFTVIDGKLIIPGGGPDGGDLILYENYRTTACLTEPDNLGLDGNDNDRVVGCDWEEPELVPVEAMGEAFCTLENIPNDTLNYGVDLVCPGEEPISIVIPDTPEPQPEPTEDFNLCAEGNEWDDGRCTDEYWWQAGFYYGLLETGEIELDDIPGPYYETPTPTPTPEPKEEKRNRRCSVEYFGEGWDILRLPSFEYITTVSVDPGLPDCNDFGY